jgi:hypothetical protein
MLLLRVLQSHVVLIKSLFTLTGICICTTHESFLFASTFQFESYLIGFFLRPKQIKTTTN